jgi:hypothetical protein
MDYVDQTHDQRIDPAAVVAGNQAERRACDTASEDADHGDEDRDPRAIEDAAQHVAAGAVGAEDVVPAAAGPDRRAQALPEAAGIGVVRRDPWREQGRNHQNDQQDGNRDQRIAAQGRPQPGDAAGRRGSDRSMLDRALRLSRGGHDPHVRS